MLFFRMSATLKFELSFKSYKLWFNKIPGWNTIKSITRTKIVTKSLMNVILKTETVGYSNLI